MAAPTEVLLTSEASGQLWSVCVWDVHTGTSLLSYRSGGAGAAAAPRTLTLLNNQHLLTAVTNKQLIHVWALQRKDQNQQRIVCPGKVSAIAATPDGLHCAVAIDEKIHVWQVSTGSLMAVLGRHYQAVTVLRCTDDGSHFVSGGEDNLVIVWSTASVLGGSDVSVAGGHVQPRFVWSSHSLPVTDVHVGSGGARSRVASASRDGTCRLWELSSGQLLRTFRFDSELTSVTLDQTETRLFAGASSGDIYQVNLYETPVRIDCHIDDNSEDALVLRGHEKHVTCLCVSLDASLLVSGSDDCSVKIWDVQGRQCVRTIPHKGGVTNVLLLMAPAALLSGEGRAPPPLPPFRRHLVGTGDEESGDAVVELRGNQIFEADEDEDSVRRCLECLRGGGGAEERGGAAREAELQRQLAELKRVNKNMFDFTAELIASQNNKT